MNDPHRSTAVLHRGSNLVDAQIAMVLLHGRGATAEDILSLVPNLYEERIAYLAPQAAGETWYPHSFLAPVEENQPWLNSALAKVETVLCNCMSEGLPPWRVVVLGFSQGACLATEFVARHPARYGALIAFTGGLVGPPGTDLHHQGSLEGTPVLLSSGDPDPHVPWDRVEATARQFEQMGAHVQLIRYPGRPHLILPGELESARKLLFSLLPGNRPKNSAIAANHQ